MHDELFEQARQYGFAEVSTRCECQLLVHYDRNAGPYSISTSSQPVSANWSGGSLIVEMENGQVRRYHGLGAHDFTEIRERRNPWE